MSDPKDPGFTVSDPPPAGELPQIDFATFVLSLAASGMMHLGMAADPTQPGSAPPEPSLPLAQQTIDTLVMLQSKTQGNLDEEERKLLESVLYELRMGFVRVRDAS
jgi:hypothetical protein